MILLPPDDLTSSNLYPCLVKVNDIIHDCRGKVGISRFELAFEARAHYYLSRR